MTGLVHPQPLGAFGFPLGFLLIGDDAAEAQAAQAELVAGRRPAQWPASLAGHALAHQGELTQARSVFAAAAARGSVIDRYNAWVLEPDLASREELRVTLPAEVAPMVDVVAVTAGLASLDPAASYDVSGLPGEVAALIKATQATAALASETAMEAPGLLLDAARAAGPQSPALAAVLVGNAAMLLHEQGAEARPLLAEALDQLAETDLGEVGAQLLHLRGSIAHAEAVAGRGDARALLEEAMRDYYAGLRLVTQESDPLLWAGLQLNLATAQLAVPMTKASDQLRLGVATQALRASRRVFTPREHPGSWSAATLNLANALVYMPSTHQGDNLVEAVELYEEVLVSGVRDRDAAGRARLLSNQGNALAHLGMLDQARAKLVEARMLFEEVLDHDGAGSVRGLLDEVAKAEAERAAQDSDPEAEQARLARQAEQMSRMPQGPGAFTAGMGVRRQSTAGDQTGPPPKPKVSVLRRGGEG